MGFLKALLYSFWPNAEGVREAMRISYAKHLRLAKTGRIPVPEGIRPHEVALYGSLASRYRALGQVWTEIELWADLAPFLQMDESNAVEALAEYAALKECPKGARLSWLKEEINRTMRKSTGNENEAALFAPLLMNERIEWWNLLDEPERLLIERRYERVFGSGVPTDENDDALKKEIADSILREAGYPTEDDEALVKEARELFLSAGYPDDLNRYFEVLRKHGVTMKLAGTYSDGSRGKFERWDFSKGSDGQNPSNVIVRFWHDTRNLDWQGILYSGKEIKEQASGQTLGQLETQLERWKDR